MRIPTSAHTEMLPAVLYEPHLLARTTAGQIIEPCPSMWDWLSKEEILAVFEQWSQDLTRKLGIVIQEQDLAALYREFEDEDRELAQAGLEEYGVLLDDADRT